MSRFPRLSISSWSGHFAADDLDLDRILGQFPRPFDACVVVDGTTDSDSADDESSDAYWGTDEDWELIDQRALSGERIDRIADYLKSTGQASA